MTLNKRTPGERLAYYEGRLAGTDARVLGLRQEIRQAAMVSKLLRRFIVKCRAEIRGARLRSLSRPAPAQKRRK